MKRIVLVFVIVFSVLPSLQAQEEATLPWHTNLEEAMELAKEEDKLVLMYFTGSDWCRPCKHLKADFFESADFAESAKEMVLVIIDIPRRQDLLSPEQLAYNMKVLSRYNEEKTFPKILALNHKGKVKGVITGYGSLRDTSPYFKFLDTYF